MVPDARDRSAAAPVSKFFTSSGVWIIVCFALMSVRLLWMIWRNQVNLLYYDEWDLYDAFMRHASWRELFMFQPGPHRQGPGFILMSWIAQTSAWNTRVMSFAVTIFSIAAAAVALVLKRRLFGGMGLSD